MPSKSTRRSPSTAVAKPKTDKVLASLPTAIIAAHQRVLAAARSGVKHARQCGVLLIRAKAKAGHRHWKTWVSTNCPGLSLRTVQCYMKVARRWSTLSETQRAASLRQVLSVLATPRERVGTGPVAYPAAVEGDTLTAGDLQAIREGEHLVEVTFGVKVVIDLDGTTLNRNGEEVTVAEAAKKVIESALAGEREYFVNIHEVREVRGRAAAA